MTFTRLQLKIFVVVNGLMCARYEWKKGIWSGDNQNYVALMFSQPRRRPAGWFALVTWKYPALYDEHFVVISMAMRINIAPHQILPGRFLKGMETAISMAVYSEEYLQIKPSPV